jgi:hypothetical protein
VIDELSTYVYLCSSARSSQFHVGLSNHSSPVSLATLRKLESNRRCFSASFSIHYRCLLLLYLSPSESRLESNHTSSSSSRILIIGFSYSLSIMLGWSGRSVASGWRGFKYCTVEVDCYCFSYFNLSLTCTTCLHFYCKIGKCLSTSATQLITPGYSSKSRLCSPLLRTIIRYTTVDYPRLSNNRSRLYHSLVHGSIRIRKK